MSETFRTLAPMFRPMLEAQPDAKRQRGHQQTPVAQASEAGQGAKQIMLLMGKMLLNHERDLHNLRSQDSYVLFVNHDEGGSLQILLQEAKKWRQQMESQTATRTLRSHLLLKLMEELKRRLQQALHPTEGVTLRKTLEDKNLLFKDQSWPYQSWSHQSQTMVTDPRRPSMPTAKLTRSWIPFWKWWKWAPLSRSSTPSHP